MAGSFDDGSEARVAIGAVMAVCSYVALMMGVQRITRNNLVDRRAPLLEQESASRLFASKVVGSMFQVAVAFGGMRIMLDPAVAIAWCTVPDPSNRPPCADNLAFGYTSKAHDYGGMALGFYLCNLFTQHSLYMSCRTLRSTEFVEEPRLWAFYQDKTYLVNHHLSFICLIIPSGVLLDVHQFIFGACLLSEITSALRQLQFFVMAAGSSRLDDPASIGKKGFMSRVIGVFHALAHLLTHILIWPYMLLTYSRTHGHAGLNHLKVVGKMNAACVLWSAALLITVWLAGPFGIKTKRRRTTEVQVKAMSQRLKKMRFVEEHQRHLIEDDVGTVAQHIRRTSMPAPATDPPAPAAEGRVRRRDPRKPSAAQRPARGVATLSKKARKEKVKAEKEKKRDEQLKLIRKFDPHYGKPELF